MEVMGLMLGEFVDEYTVQVVDVFAMPQSGTGVSVEAVDPVFQTKMMEMLRQTGRYAYIRIFSSFCINTDKFACQPDQKALSAGITPTPVSDAGSPPSMSTPSSRSSS